MKRACWFALLLLTSACFEPQLSDEQRSSQDSKTGDSSDAGDTVRDGSAKRDAATLDTPDAGQSTDAGEHATEKADGGDASGPRLHGQCATPAPNLLPALTGATPWFPPTPVRACSETPRLTSCGLRDACPFEGRCLHIDGVEGGVCVRGEGTLPLVFRGNTCVAWVDEVTRASLCCAGLSDLDCEETPRVTRGGPGALCGRHDDCAEGLVCKADDTIGRCLCPESELASLAASNSCEGAAATRSWGVPPRYDSAHTCLAGPTPGVSIDVLFDRVVADDYRSTFDALVDAEIAGDAMHIAYAAQDGVVMHLVVEDGAMRSVAARRLPWAQGGGVVSAEIGDIDLALDELAPNGPIAHLAIATSTRAGIVYWSGDTFAQVGARAKDIALGFDDSLSNQHPGARTPVLAFPEGEGVQVLALQRDRFERAFRFDFESYGDPWLSELALTNGPSGETRLLLSKMANEGVVGTAWFAERASGQERQRQVEACRSPTAAGNWFACDDAKGAVWIGEANSKDPATRVLLRASEAYELENTLPALGETASNRVHLAYRTPEGVEVRELGADGTPRLLTRDRTTTRAVVVPLASGEAGVLYTTTSTLPHHHQLRFAHPGPCLIKDRVVPAAPEPTNIAPTTHPSCSTPLTFEFADPFAERDGSGRPLVTGMSGTSCDALGVLRECSATDPCFAGEVCLQTRTPGLRVCIGDARVSDEECHLPSREDPQRRGVLGITDEGQCLRCFSPESKRAACCAGVVGLDCREWPYAAPGGPGEMCTQQAECEPGLICADTWPGQACACPEYTYSPGNDPALCDPPAHAKWRDGGSPRLVPGQCVVAATPGWSIECVADLKGSQDEPMEGQFAAAPDGSLWLALSGSLGVALAHLADGKWVRQVLSKSPVNDASIAVDKNGTLYLIITGVFPGATGSAVMSNESGIFKAWGTATKYNYAVGETFVDARGVLHFLGDYGNVFGYLRIDRSQFSPQPIPTDLGLTEYQGLDLRPKLVRDSAGALHLYTTRLGGKIQDDHWLAEPVPAMVEAAGGPKGVVRVEESAPHGFRIVTAEDVSEAWQNPDPHFEAGATEPSLAIASNGALWVSHRAPTGLRVTTNAEGGWKSVAIVGAQLNHEMVLDANDQPHVFYKTSPQDEVSYLHHVFRGACAGDVP